MSYILETKDARFSYETGEAALSGVSVRIAEGKKTVLLGPNGSGKSTLFLHMNGVLKPQKGIVLFRGEPIKYDRANIASLRQKVCLMFQNPDDQIFAATVEEDVAFGPLNLKLSSDVVEKRVEEALCAVDMQKYRDRPTQQLSGPAAKASRDGRSAGDGPRTTPLWTSQRPASMSRWCARCSSSPTS